MYYACKNCAKSGNCFSAMRLKFGFCEKDFTPKNEPVPLVGMQWKQLSSTSWEAVGRFGKFLIERSGGKFWARYSSSDTAFKMPPRSRLSEAKDFCERNEYWEEKQNG